MGIGVRELLCGSAGVLIGYRGTIGQAVGGDVVGIIVFCRIACCGNDGCIMSGLDCDVSDVVSPSRFGGVKCAGGGACGIWMMGTLGYDAGRNTSGVYVGCMIGTLGCVCGRNTSGVRRISIGLQQVVLLKSVTSEVSVSVLDGESGVIPGDVVVPQV